MRRAVGPLDKRKRVTRCQSCVKRRIKCQGLFELMSETSGERWIKHMLYGTCRILQSKDPGNLGPLSERLFEAFSLLEASRAIIYGESTFLFQDSWMKRNKSSATDSSDSMEAMLGFLVRVSMWSKSSFFYHLEAIPSRLRASNPTVQLLTLQARYFQVEAERKDI
ncbi:hypothetical protein CEP53_010266 [Fusarium sp. AF-6]|nr:hypothetical protein CEP53_010266 [Fusarium sp. AF-6]